MANGQARSRGCGCVLVFVFALVACLSVAYGLGALDYLHYRVSGAQDYGQEAVDQSFAHRTETELHGLSYAYSQLDEDDQRCYRIMYEAFRTRASLAYPEGGQESLTRIRACIIADHPELFYVEGAQLSTTYNQVSDLVTDTTISGSYYLDEEETAAIQAQIDQEVAAFLATVPADADDYQKAKLAYEYIIRRASYDHDASDMIDWGIDESKRSPGQTMDDVFINNAAVCAGYSAAYQYLLQQMGIVCVQVRGEADGVAHAWCVALLDGSYYHIDPTWGDPQFSDESSSVGSDFVNYEYLNVTSADIGVTHVLDNVFEVPTCESIDDNYFVHEGLYFSDADSNRFGTLVSDAERQGVSSVQIRCASDDVYHALLDGFVARGDLGYYVSDYEYRYTYHDALRTIIVFP